MSTQPEALRLADALTTLTGTQKDKHTTAKQAAAELRLLYWDELRVREHRDEMCAELRRLHAINAELVEALKECIEDSEQAVSDYLQKYGPNYRPERLTAMSETVAKARAAIAKAEGRQS